MIYKVLSDNFCSNRQHDRNKIPNKAYFKLINPNGEIIAGKITLLRQSGTMVS
jgi:hypothetical protein